MPLGSFSKDKLVFDPTVPIESDNVGAFVRAGTDGEQISWTGVVDSPASLVLQDLTYTAACTDFDAGNSITIEYADTATAGAETVLVTGPAILVGIESGVSTALQIKAAIEASLAASELVSVSVSGVGSNAQVTDGPDSLSGGTTKPSLDVHMMGSPHNGQYHEDCQHTSGDKGQFILGVRHDDDSTGLVSHDGDYTPLLFDATGRLKVSAEIEVASDFVYREDDNNPGAQLGAYVLATRQDVLAISTSASSDFADFKVNDRGGLWTVPVGTVADDAADNEYPVKTGTRSAWGVLTAVSADDDRADAISDKYRRLYVNNGSNIAILNQNIPVDNTAAVAIPGSSLQGRRTIMMQNLSNKEVYLGTASVSSANGFVIAARATISLDLGPDITVYLKGSDASSQNIRILEMA